MSPTFRIDLSVALDRFNLALRWESCQPSLGLFGHSGAGKTTVLEAIAGLREGVTGLVEVRGVRWLDTAAGIRLAPERRGVGYVPQDLRLFPHRTVMGNLLAGRRRARGRPTDRLDPGRVVEILELDHARGDDPSQLSGGEQRRVALGRALCSGPDLLLLDEPLGGLDLPLRRRILPYLLRVQREFGIPTLYVSHDPAEVRMLSAEVAVLDMGRLVALGPPDDVFADPKVHPIASEEGFENILRGRVVSAAEATATIELEPGLTVVVPGRSLEGAVEAIVGIRAEDLILAVQAPAGLSAQNVLGGTIRDIRQVRPAAQGGGESGAEEQVLVAIGLGSGDTKVVAAITARALRGLGLARGLPVHLVFKTHACRVLAAL